MTTKVFSGHEFHDFLPCFILLNNKDVQRTGSKTVVVIEISYQLMYFKRLVQLVLLLLYKRLTNVHLIAPNSI